VSLNAKWSEELGTILVQKLSNTEGPKLQIHSSYSHTLIIYTAMLNLYTALNSTMVAPTPQIHTETFLILMTAGTYEGGMLLTLSYVTLS
jgi:hypothetical protein